MAHPFKIIIDGDGHITVITSHTATLWRALALAGVDDSVYGVGSLLEGGRD